MSPDPDFSSLDQTLTRINLLGEWRENGSGQVACGYCGHILSTELQVKEARDHWELHTTVPSAANEYQMIWYNRPDFLQGSYIVRGSFPAFLRVLMGRNYLRSYLAFPRLSVVQEFVSLGETSGPTPEGSYDWPRFAVTEESYEVAKTVLIDSGQASSDAEPLWVDSLFYRQVLRTATDTGHDVHHMIRRSAVIGELLAIEGFPGISEELSIALSRRIEQAIRFEFGRSLEPLFDPSD
jgi:hypothetical protein